MSTGIIPLAEMIAEHVNNGGLDDDDDFAGTSYDGPKIIRASFVGFEEYERLKDSPRPNLIAMIVRFEYERLRISTDKLTIRNLLVGIKEKILQNINLMQVFEDRVMIADDLVDPFVERRTQQTPFLVIKPSAMASAVQFSQQRNEIISVAIEVFTQRTTKTIESALIGV